ncbi:hypothetical protein [Paraburkholderia sp. BL25I1N1]|uniref:hypothetical protein n=1 Tax=Paraburkholderia sp. BL25I1N1 TaxID=1938804 RepID=UPI000D0588E6|nr:hypothetical protein [Paraburkholderia sp. BL25I1N1]PRY09252.1 hypothetical protein B0G73_101158 [Paraburkholderia sp. BL25I1N1]
MNRFNPIARAASVLAVIATTAACAAQPVPPPQPGAPLPPPAPSANAPLPPPFAEAPRDGAPATVSGVLQRFVINPEGDVDGMLLADNTLVRFPPHIGTQVAAAFAPGATVNVNGFAQPGGTLRARQIADANNGRSVVDQPPPADAQRPPKLLAGVGLVKLDATGRVLRVTSAPRGEPDGVLLTDGTVIKLTPPAAARFATLLQPGATIAAQGYGTRNRYGESLQATAFGTPGNLTVIYDVPPR